jgi:hypothetical protein
MDDPQAGQLLALAVSLARLDKAASYRVQGRVTSAGRPPRIRRPFPAESTPSPTKADQLFSQPKSSERKVTYPFPLDDAPEVGSAALAAEVYILPTAVCPGA